MIQASLYDRCAVWPLSSTSPRSHLAGDSLDNLAPFPRKWCHRQDTLAEIQTSDEAAQKSRPSAPIAGRWSSWPRPLNRTLKCRNTADSGVLAAWYGRQFLPSSERLSGNHNLFIVLGMRIRVNRACKPPLSCHRTTLPPPESRPG